MEEWGPAIRGLRWWLAGVVALLVALLGVSGFTCYIAWEDSSLSYVETDVAKNPAMVTRIRDAMQGSFGDELASVEAYETAFRYDDGSSISMRPVAVTYRLKSVDTTITGLVDSVSALGDSGVDPTLSDLLYQIKSDDYLAILRAWKARSSEPIGYVYPYSKVSDFNYEDYVDEVTIFGKVYKTDHLWIANEGWVPAAGAVFTGDDIPDVRAMVFDRDPKTGQFTYVGTEPAPIGCGDFIVSADEGC